MKVHWDVYHLPRRTIRMIRPRPYFHTQVKIPMYLAYWVVLILVGDLIPALHTVTRIIWYVVALVAIGQWFWWGRRRP